jgi:hypothetical protein
MKTVSWANISINQFLGLGLIKYLMRHARVDKVAVRGRLIIDSLVTQYESSGKVLRKQASREATTSFEFQKNDIMKRGQNAISPMFMTPIS